MGTETNDIINELFKSFLKRYQEGLETKMKGSNFVLESVEVLYYKLHKISLNRGGSYIASPKWILLLIANNDEHDNGVNNDGVNNWHYLAIKSLSKLLRGITSNHVGNFYGLNCFHSYRTKTNLKNMKRYVKNMISVM